MKTSLYLFMCLLVILITGCKKDPFTGNDSGTFTDSRDNLEYNWIRIGEQIWMAENLAYLPDVTPENLLETGTAHNYVNGYAGTSAAEARGTANYTTYGALYNFEAAKVVCPEGWHCPTDAEWQELESYLGMPAEDVAKTGPRSAGGLIAKLSSASGWTGVTGNTNSSGFTALPAGFIWQDDFSAGIGSSACFWTSTAADDNNAWDRYFDKKGEGIDRSAYPRNNAYSVRCLRD